MIMVQFEDFLEVKVECSNLHSVFGLIQRKFSMKRKNPMNKVYQENSKFYFTIDVFKFMHQSKVIVELIRNIRVFKYLLSILARKILKMPLNFIFNTLDFLQCLVGKGDVTNVLTKLYY